MRFAPLMYTIIALLAVFGALSIIIAIKAISTAHKERREGLRSGRSLRERARDYIGPVDRSKAVLNPPLRVLVEMFLALGGFPGLGWLLSGRILPGLILLSVVPSLVWGLVPVALSVTGLLTLSAYSVVIYLPLISLASATCLAIAETRGRIAEEPGV